MQFPTVSGSNLEGRKYALPADFDGDYNVVVLAYWQRQQLEVNTWLPVLAQFADEYAGLAYYELPTLRRYNPVMRWWIDTGMKSGIPDRGARERTITLYLDVAAFNGALGVPSQDNIHTFVVDRAGQVHWHAEGVADADKIADLRAALNGLFTV